jgi:hypothetical protein
MRALLTSSFLLAAVPFLVRASNPAASQEFPFQFREGLLWVEVRAPQSPDPLHFLLDSGAGTSVIDLTSAERLGLKLGKRVSVKAVGSTSIGFWPERLVASASSVALPTTYLAVDLSGLSASCACPVDGLIGVDFFREHVVQIDFSASKIRLLPALPAGENQDLLPLDVRKAALRVPVQVNGGPARLVRLDTGCASGLHWVATYPRSQAGAQRVAIGLAPVSVTVASSTVQLGATSFDQVATDLHSEPIFPGEAGLLGNALLSRFASVTVDAKAGSLALQRAQPATLPAAASARP